MVMDIEDYIGITQEERDSRDFEALLELEDEHYSIKDFAKLLVEFADKPKIIRCLARQLNHTSSFD